MGYKEGKTLTLKEAAEELKFDESTIRYNISRGRLEAFRHSGKWYILESSVAAFKKYLDTKNAVSLSRKK